MLDEGDERLRETILTYDVLATEYTQRFADADLHEHRSRFAARLPTTGSGLILDVGCGGGRDCPPLSQFGDVVGIDISSGMLAVARRSGVPLVQADSRVLPLRSEVAAGAWCCASLVHLAAHQVAVALGELARVVCDGGGLFASFRAEPGPGWEGKGSRRRWLERHSPEEVRTLLEDASFDVVEVETEDDAARRDGPRWVSAHARRRPRARSTLAIGRGSRLFT